MTIASLGSICTFEHMFDKKFEHPGSIEYKNVLKTDYTLIRNTVLNGGKPKILDAIITLSDKEKFLTNIRLSSSKEWICQDDMHFVIHNFYGGKNYRTNEELRSNIRDLFDKYREIDIFMYYSYLIEDVNQIKMLHTACRLYNNNAKLLVFSNLPDMNIDNTIINMHIQEEITFSDVIDLRKENCTIFERRWNIPNRVLEKLKNINFDSNLFNNY